MTYRWKLKDIIMVGILGVIFAVIYLAVLYAGLGVTAVLTPYGLGTLGFEIFYGIWFMGATLAMYIIQKPGVAIVTEFLAAFLEMLMGNSGGPMVLLSGAMQGLGCELGFTVFRYKRYDMLSMCMSGIFAALISFAFGFIQAGFGLIDAGLLVVMLGVRIATAVLFAGVISKKTGDGLAKTGVLKSYELGMRMRPAEVLDD
ncbi:MAG: ECF transporter S component [Christensenellaceae bacterium]|jgi:energy-coupling factor transport system substrate-specific component